MPNQDGMVVAWFTRVVEFEDGVDNVQCPRDWETNAKDGVEEMREKQGGRME